MQLKTVKKSVDGEIEAVFMLTPVQMQILLNYAVKDLVSKGLIQELEITEEEMIEYAKEQESVAQKEFLETLDINNIPKA